jgi:hypothetical protein
MNYSDEEFGQTLELEVKILVKKIKTRNNMENKTK